MSALLICALFALGHVVRDGWPDFNTLTGGDPLTGKRGWLGTHAARGAGAALCGLGAFAVYGMEWLALALWLAVWLGFYLDQRHAAGQNAEGWRDGAFLMISGVTSVALAVFTLFMLREPMAALAVLGVGASKPAYWFLCRRAIGGDWTRWAAGAFGAAFGAAIAV